MVAGTKQTKLDKLLRQQQRIAKQIEQQRTQQLKDLPAQVGLSSVQELIKALQGLSSGRGRQSSNTGSAVSPAGARKQKTARRSRYSDEAKAAVQADLAKGEDTDRAISKRHNVPLATLTLWKRQWGLTKKRRKKKKR